MFENYHLHPSRSLCDLKKADHDEKTLLHSVTNSQKRHTVALSILCITNTHSLACLYVLVITFYYNKKLRSGTWHFCDCMCKLNYFSNKMLNLCRNLNSFVITVNLDFYCFSSGWPPSAACQPQTSWMIIRCARCCLI